MYYCTTVPLVFPTRKQNKQDFYNYIEDSLTLHIFTIVTQMKFEFSVFVNYDLN